MWINVESFLKTPDGTQLFFESWKRKDAKSALLIVHGQGEHSESYQRFIDDFETHGDMDCDIYAFDFRGHGRSDGLRGYAQHAIQYVEDFETVLEHLKSIGVRPIILCHSMGAMVVIAAQLQKNYEKRFGSMLVGQILSAPLFGVALDVPKWKINASHFMNKIYPKITLWNEITDDMLTQDLSIQQEYQRDPLRHQKISPGVFLGFFDFFEEIKRDAGRITTPTFLFMSEHDPVVSIQAALEVFDLLGSAQKEKKIFTSGKHELLNDISREKVYALIQTKILEWKGHTK